MFRSSNGKRRRRLPSLLLHANASRQSKPQAAALPLKPFCGRGWEKTRLRPARTPFLEIPCQIPGTWCPSPCPSPVELGGRYFSYAPRRAKKKSTAITRANPTQPAAPDTAYPTGAPHPDPTHSPAHPPPSRLTPYPSPAHHLGPYQLTCPSLPYEKLLVTVRKNSLSYNSNTHPTERTYQGALLRRWKTLVSF